MYKRILWLFPLIGFMLMNTEVLSADASEGQETIESTTATEAFVSEVTAAELLIEEPTQEKIVPVHEKTLPEKSTETISSNETPPTEITTEDLTATQPIENQGPNEEEDLLSKEKDSVEIPITEPEEKGEEDLNSPNEESQLEKPQPEESKSEEPESEEPQPEKTEPEESTESNDPEVTPETSKPETPEPETSEKPVLPSVPTEEPTPDAELPLESITVTPPKKEVIVGETLDRLTVEYHPGNAIKPKWEYWWSLNPQIATVDAGTGIITAIRAGTAMIMVEVDTGQETGTLVTVVDPAATPEPPLESITVTPPKKELTVGETQDRLTVVYNPGNAVKPKWEYWWSLNPDIATVDAATGIITAIRAGTAMIMVEVDTGQETGTLVTVVDPTTAPEPPLESISIVPPTTNIAVGETVDRLNVVYQPGNAVKTKWEYWWSLNPDIATVDAATGIITTWKNGKATIMVEVDTGQEAATVITVGTIATGGPNSQIYLPIPTPYDDGVDWPGRTNQATHPSVIQFEEAWNGYKYWMGFTPYPYGDDQKENPSIVASHDGINWVVPDFVLNPLAPIELENGYNSDTHLVYNDVTKELELWYRQVNNLNYEETLLRVKTSDGINWSAPEAMTSAANNFLQYIAPSVIYENNLYKMWFMRDWEVHYAESIDGKDWSEAITINTVGNTVHTWHPSVVKFEDTYYLLNNDNDTNEGIRGVIKYSTSTDGINFTEEKLILAYTDNGYSYDSAGVYRASMAMGEHGVYLYYGQISESHQWTIGMSIGTDLDHLVGLDEETLAGYLTA